MDLWNIGRRMHELWRSTAPYLQDLPAVSNASMGHLTRTRTFGSFYTARAGSGAAGRPSMCVMAGTCGSDQVDGADRCSLPAFLWLDDHTIGYRRSKSGALTPITSATCLGWRCGAWVSAHHRRLECPDLDRKKTAVAKGVTQTTTQ